MKNMLITCTLVLCCLMPVNQAEGHGNQATGSQAVSSGMALIRNDRAQYLGCCHESCGSSTKVRWSRERLFRAFVRYNDDYEEYYHYHTITDSSNDCVGPGNSGYSSSCDRFEQDCYEVKNQKALCLTTNVSPEDVTSCRNTNKNKYDEEEWDEGTKMYIYYDLDEECYDSDTLISNSCF